MLAAAEHPGVTVSELCRQLGVSRQTFYELRRRFRDEGAAGLEPRSRRPHHSPEMIAAELEDEIVRLRKQLPLDNGAQTIAYHLERTGWPVPSVRTIHRALVRRGQVVAQPEKRPRSSFASFRFPEPNACWQIDATEWPLARGVTAWIMDTIDDHSRVVPSAVVGTGPTSALAWAAFERGATTWGPPAMVLSDNGTCFVGVNRGGSSFQANLAALGIRTINARPYHPQTCGKIERFHQTLKRWLAAQRRARDRAELQAQLDEFLAFYNHDRPHRALGGATPAECFAARTPASPAPEAFTPLPKIAIASVKVTRNGVVSIGGKRTTSVGAEWTGRRLTVIHYGTRVAILDGHQLVTRLEVDLSRQYQPSGRPRGRRPRRPT